MRIMHELEITAEIAKQFGEGAANNFADVLGAINSNFDPQTCPHQHLRYIVNTVNNTLKIIGSQLRVETITRASNKGYYFEVYDEK